MIHRSIARAHMAPIETTEISGVDVLDGSGRSQCGVPVGVILGKMILRRTRDAVAFGLSWARAISPQASFAYPFRLLG